MHHSMDKIKGRLAVRMSTIVAPHLYNDHQKNSALGSVRGMRQLPM